MTQERWLPVRGFEGLYEVSDLGRCRSIVRQASTTFGPRLYGGHILSPVAKNNGYFCWNLTARDGRREQVAAHRAVLVAFAGAAPEGYEACHNDGVRSNNCITNLRWDTRSANHADKYLHGTAQVGERNGAAKLTEAAVRRIRSCNEATKDISREMNVSLSTVLRVRSNQSWRHL